MDQTEKDEDVPETPMEIQPELEVVVELEAAQVTEQ